LGTRPEDAQHSRFVMALVALESLFLGTILMINAITLCVLTTISKRLNKTRSEAPLTLFSL